MTKSRPVLVTGGAGYIGSHACKGLAEAGFYPVTYDNLCTGWRDMVRFGPLIEGDLRDGARLRTVLQDLRPEAVLHFAALSSVADSVSNEPAYWDNNLQGSTSLLEAMADTGVAKLVFSSTCAVNGNHDAGIIDETTPFAPVSPYGSTKAAVEKVIAEHVASRGLRALCFRYFNVAGADSAAEIGERHVPETHLLPRALAAAFGQGAGAEFKIYGDDYPTRDGTCIRDYVHVMDLARAHVDAIGYLDRPQTAPVLCLGSANGLTVLEMISWVERVTGRPLPHSIAARRTGDPVTLICDSTLARREIGWNPVRSAPERMIADALRWHQKDGMRG